MDLLKHLTIKISLSEEPQSSNEDEVEGLYCIKVPFPDEDMWCYVRHEGSMWDGDLKTFNHAKNAREWAKNIELTDFVIEKIR